MLYILCGVLLIERALQISKQRIRKSLKKVGVIFFFYLYLNLCRDNSLCSRSSHRSSYRFLSKRCDKRAVAFSSRRFDKYRKLYLYEVLIQGIISSVAVRLSDLWKSKQCMRIIRHVLKLLNWKPDSIFKQ